ncbi:MAG: DUF1800 family protein, partial [Gaiellaceae bacterium]
PVVHTAGLLRALGRPVDTSSWVWIADLAGQRLFYPPNVAGWNESRWLDTSTFRGRWYLSTYASEPRAIEPSRKARRSTSAKDVVDRAHAFWGRPELTPATRRLLLSFTRGAIAAGGKSDDQRAANAVLAENAVRQLIAVSPDFQTC